MMKKINEIQSYTRVCTLNNTTLEYETDTKTLKIMGNTGKKRNRVLKKSGFKCFKFVLKLQHHHGIGRFWSCTCTTDVPAK